MTIDRTSTGQRPPAEREAVSVVVPVFNEEDSIAPLCSALDEVLRAVGKPYKIILVNDGSVDRSRDEIIKAAKLYPQVVGINLRRNYGQTVALMRQRRGQAPKTASMYLTSRDHLRLALTPKFPQVRLAL